MSDSLGSFPLWLKSHLHELISIRLFLWAHFLEEKEFLKDHLSFQNKLPGSLHKPTEENLRSSFFPNMKRENTSCADWLEIELYNSILQSVQKCTEELSVEFLKMSSHTIKLHTVKVNLWKIGDKMIKSGEVQTQFHFWTINRNILNTIFFCLPF